MSNKGLGVLGLLGAILLAVFSVPAFATLDCLGVQFTLEGGNMFFKNPPPPGEFFISESIRDPNKWSGHLLIEGSIWDDYEIRDAEITLTPAQLLDDDSQPSSPFDPMNPSIARGLFDDGSILTINGSITTKDGASELFAYGTILEAKVNYDFWVTEQESFPMGDTLSGQMASMTVIGGELKTGAATGFVLPYFVTTDLSLLWCRNTAGPGMGTLDNFGSDAYYNGPSTGHIYPVPEPVSFALLAFGSLLALRRRGGKRC